MDPLVVTLLLDAPAQDFFEAERRRWFPPERTQVGAHVTLFHAVPGELEDRVRGDLADQAGPAFPVAVAGVLPLGRGVAYQLVADELTRRHAVLQQLWWTRLTRQDRQPLRAHVTVQNKVDPAEARATLAVLRRRFRPYEVTATGFGLWRYEGGPWARLADVAFPPPGVG